VRKHQHLAVRIGAVAAMAALVGASAFADSRPSNETRWRGDRNDRPRQERSADREPSRHGDDSWRGQRDRGRSESNRNNGSYERGRSYDHRQPYRAHGRVSRVSPYGSGFRVWIGGAPYPFFVPRAHFRADRFRVGVVLNLGGYYNPGGYYDYYDGGYSAGTLRGVVESVDYRRGTFVIRNEASGSFVTVESRDRRRDVRPGDYVELSGDWTRGGVFAAYDVDLLDDGYYRR